MNRYEFKVGGIEPNPQIECLSLHTALYKLGLVIERNYKTHIQPGLTIQLVNVTKNIKKAQSIKIQAAEAAGGMNDGLDERNINPVAADG